jgi:hypothetical protein
MTTRVMMIAGLIMASVMWIVIWLSGPHVVGGVARAEPVVWGHVIRGVRPRVAVVMVVRQVIIVLMASFHGMPFLIVVGKPPVKRMWQAGREVPDQGGDMHGRKRWKNIVFRCGPAW